MLLKLAGKLEKGKLSNINFKEIEEVARGKAFAFLKSTSQLAIEETKIEIDASDMDKIEEEIIKNYQSNQSDKNFSKFIPSLMNSLSLEKQEDEKSAVFTERLVLEIKKILNLQ